MTEKSNQCELLVGGQVHGGWTRVEIQRSIEQIAGGFNIGLTTRWPGVGVPIGLREGLPCEVRLGGDTVINGYIDTVELDLTDSRSVVRVEGRDKTGDLVDCSAIHKTGQWRGATLAQIVTDIAAPFGISVKVDADLGEAFKRFALEDGEHAFDAIERACRLRAVMVTSTPAGHLLLTKAGSISAGVVLKEGLNIKSISASHSWRERHSQIIVKAQVPGDDDENGVQAAHLKTAAADAEVNRYRPLIVMAEHGTSSKSLADRARWEALVRMGRGKRGQCTVVGWRTGTDGQSGPLWQPNTLVRIESERMNLAQEMLIVGCCYSLSDEGTLTDLTFARREAFELVPGVGQSRLSARLNHKTEREKRRKSDGRYESPWDFDPPSEVRR